MTRAETEILVWLAAEQRPVSHLVAFPARRLDLWIRSHGGGHHHLDAAERIREALRLRFSVRIADANARRL